MVHILDLLMKEVRLDTSMVIQGTYDFRQGTNIGYSYGSNHLVQTGQDAGEINQRYTLGGGGTARTDVIQNYVESLAGKICTMLLMT